MRFARWTYLTAGVYGLVILIPGLFGEQLQGQMTPPPINHPEFYYGFFGSALAWQVLFLAIARDPARYRPLMLVTLIEKAAFPIACWALLLTHRMTVGGPFIGSQLDVVWGVLFLIAWLRTPKSAAS